MDQQVEQKIAEILEALQHGAVQVGDKVIQYGPDIADALLWVVRLDGAQRLVWGVAAVALMIWGWRSLVSAYGRIEADMEASKASYKTWDEKHYVMFWGRAIPTALISILGIVSGAVFSVINIWTYAAIFSPKLWLAREIVNKVLK